MNAPEVGFEPTTNGLTVQRNPIAYNNRQYVAIRNSMGCVCDVCGE